MFLRKYRINGYVIAEAVEENKQRYQVNQALYRKRQEINEHIFGTIKRQWGYNHTNLTGLKKVNGEMALIMTVYNIKRSINIMGIEKLIAKLKTWKPDYKKACCVYSKTTSLEAQQRLINIEMKLAA